MDEDELIEPEGRPGLNTLSGQENEAKRINGYRYQDFGNGQVALIHNLSHKIDFTTDPETGLTIAPLTQNIELPDEGDNSFYLSKYDDFYNIGQGELKDVNTHRYNNQPWWDMLGNIGMHTLVNFTTALIDGAAFIYGASGVAGGVNKTSSLLNAFSNWYDKYQNGQASIEDFRQEILDIESKQYTEQLINNELHQLSRWLKNDVSEKYFKNYRPTVIENMPWYEQIFNQDLLYTFGQLIEMSGTVAGMALSGSYLAKGALLTMKAGQALLKTGTNAFKASDKVGKVLNKIFGIDDGMAITASLKPTRASMAASSFGEASMEGSNNYMETKAKLQDKYKDDYNNILQNIEKLDLAFEAGQIDERTWNQSRSAWEGEKDKLDKQIDAAAISAGLSTFTGNLPILLTSNLVSYWNIGKQGLFSNINRIAQTGKQGNAVATYAKDFSKKFISEGIWEEMGQGIVSATSTDYAEWLMDNYDNATVDMNFNAKMGKYFSLLAGLAANTYFNIDNDLWSEGFYGGLIGGFGFMSPRSMHYTDANGKQHWRLPLTLQGGAWGSVKDLRNLRQEAQQIANIAQQTYNNDTWVNNMRSLIRQGKLAQIYDESLAKNDTYTAATVEAALLIDAIIAAKRSGNLNILEQQLSLDVDKLKTDNSYLMSVVNDMDVVGQDGKVTNPFKDENGLIKVETARKQLEQNYLNFNFIKDLINKSYEQARNAVNGTYGLRQNAGPVQNIIEDLTYKHVLSYSYMNRAGQMIEKIDLLFNDTRNMNDLPDAVRNNPIFKHLELFKQNYLKLLEEYKSGDKIPGIEWIRKLDAMFINPEHKGLWSWFKHDIGHSEAAIAAFTEAYEDFLNDSIKEYAKEFGINEDVVDNLTPLQKLAIMSGKAIINKEGEFVIEKSPDNWQVEFNFKDLKTEETYLIEHQQDHDYVLDSDEQKFVNSVRQSADVYKTVTDIEKCLRKAYELRTFVSRMHNNPEQMMRHYNEYAKQVQDSLLRQYFMDRIEKAFKNNLSVVEIIKTLPPNCHGWLLKYLIDNHPELIRAFELALKDLRYVSEIMSWYNSGFAKTHYIDSESPNTLELINNTQFYSDAFKAEVEALISDFQENNQPVTDLIDKLRDLKKRIEKSLLQEQTLQGSSQYNTDDLLYINLLFRTIDTIDNASTTNFWLINKEEYDKLIKYQKDKAAAEKLSSESLANGRKAKTPEDDDDDDEETDEEMPEDVDDNEPGNDGFSIRQKPKLDNNTIEEKIKEVRDLDRNIGSDTSADEKRKQIVDIINLISELRVANVFSNYNGLYIDELKNIANKYKDYRIIDNKYNSLTEENDTSELSNQNYFETIDRKDDSLTGDLIDYLVDRPAIISPEGVVVQRGLVIRYTKNGGSGNSNVTIDSNVEQLSSELVNEIEKDSQDLVQFSINIQEGDDTKKQEQQNKIDALIDKILSFENIANDCLSSDNGSGLIELTVQMLYDKLNQIQESINNIKSENEELKDEIKTLKDKLNDSVSTTLEKIVVNSSEKDIVVNPSNNVEFKPISRAKQGTPSNVSGNVSFNGYSMMKPYFEHPNDREDLPGLRARNSDEEDMAHVLVRNEAIRKKGADEEETEGTLNYELYYEFNVKGMLEYGRLQDFINEYKEAHDNEEPPIHVFYKIYKSNDERKPYKPYRYIAIEINEGSLKYVDDAGTTKFIEHNGKRYQVIGSFSFETVNEATKDAGNSIIAELNTRALRNNGASNINEWNAGFEELYERDKEQFYYVSEANDLFYISSISAGTYVLSTENNEDRYDTVSVEYLMQKDSKNNYTLEMLESGEISFAIKTNSGQMVLSKLVPENLRYTSADLYNSSLLANDVVMYVKQADGRIHAISIRRNNFDANKLLSSNNDISKSIQESLKVLLYKRSTKEAKAKAFNTIAKYLRLPAYNAKTGKYALYSGFGEPKSFNDKSASVIVRYPNKPNIEELVLDRIEKPYRESPREYDESIRKILYKLESFNIRYNVLASTVSDVKWLNDLIHLGAFSTQLKTLQYAMPTIFFGPQVRSENNSNENELQTLQPSENNIDTNEDSAQKAIMDKFESEINNPLYTTRLKDGDTEYILFENGDDKCVMYDGKMTFDLNIIDKCIELKNQKQKSSESGTISFSENYEKFVDYKNKHIDDIKNGHDEVTPTFLRNIFEVDYNMLDAQAIQDLFDRIEKNDNLLNQLVFENGDIKFKEGTDINAFLSCL